MGEIIMTHAHVVSDFRKFAYRPRTATKFRTTSWRVYGKSNVVSCFSICVTIERPMYFVDVSYVDLRVAYVIRNQVVNVL